MRKKAILLLCGASLVLLIVGASVLYRQFADRFDMDNLAGTDSTTQNQQSSQENSGQEQAKQFPPDFTVVDATGREVKLSDFRGKPTVVNFWASWCGPCKSEMPDFESVWQRMGNDVHFLMVNMTDGHRETIDSAKEFMTDSGYHFPVYYDTQYSAAMAYGVSSLPTTYFFDAEGYAVAYAMSAISEEALLRGIDMITNR